MPAERADMSFVIVDVEADGPIPAEYSMVCFDRVTQHTHHPVDDARGKAEALKKFRELWLGI